MNLKLALAAVLIAPLALTACAKKDATPQDTTEASAPAENDKVTPEQQAAIDSLDKPVLDEKNTDVPAEIANAPADEATADTEQTEASAAAH
ncbi:MULTISPECIES: hypothetical protein [Acinetobacter]|jgi:hypothetical protein|uniref:Lipoprotein n=1 Tax=Acinetobacter chengduensis TaxID=2420890 RepID=A0ABX9U0A6_9GAMM|nr:MULTISPECIES: hypothetical protein [Acinetobacter]MBI1452538.1 hypothetical protein [Acinetobacter sp. FL51]RKG44784.1 hypothetical protein D7V31_00870 [Acinetobacter sp. WCHAc060007]RLL23549.1 hypothetical protein D9K81_03995 [Acinetobacter chengduensis]